jgi:hypothetical protein
MSIEDLAIDVGLTKDTDEYDSFLRTVHNISELGCGYSEKVHQDIIDKCKTSELDIARKVISASTQNTRIRRNKLKWWQTYQSKQYITDKIYIDRNPQAKQSKRPMSPMFRGERVENRSKRRVEKQSKRPMSPMFRGERVERNRQRPMSPMFRGERVERNKRNFQRDQLHHRDRPSYNRKNQHRKRTRYEEPSLEYERNYEDRNDRPVSYGQGSSKKRRRYN